MRGEEILLLRFFGQLLAGKFHLAGKRFQLGTEVIGDDVRFVHANGSRFRPRSQRDAGALRIGAPVEQIRKEFVGEVTAPVDLLLLVE